MKAWGATTRRRSTHYLTAFAIEHGRQRPALRRLGLELASSTTLQIAAIAAPLTAAIGLLTAYLLTRQHFAGKRAFEFATMLSFAIPGTVIGVSYILAFNVPPIELTGTGLILVICFVFRNMPVGVRAGIADAEPDRQEPRRGLAHAGRALRHDRAPGRAAAAAAGDRGGAGLLASCAP